MTKKKLFTLAIAVCMIAILSFSSLAWFSDDDTVTNKFQLATSTEDKDDIFSVDVLEGIEVALAQFDGQAEQGGTVVQIHGALMGAERRALRRRSAAGWACCRGPACVPGSGRCARPAGARSARACPGR